VVTLLELTLGLAFLLGKTPRWLLLAGVGLHAALYLCLPVAHLLGDDDMSIPGRPRPRRRASRPDRAAHSIDRFDRTACSEDRYCVCATH
jgi:hypothetical protein